MDTSPRLCKRCGGDISDRAKCAKYCVYCHLEMKMERAIKHTSRSQAKKRRYGFNMLNVYFPGSAAHHVNDFDVVFIPNVIHSSFGGGKNKELHRKKAMDLYGSLENMINGKIPSRPNV